MKLTQWVCERCGATFAEYVNGCPKCETGEVGGSAKAEAVTVGITDESELSTREER